MNKIEKFLHTTYSIIGIGLIVYFAVWWFNPANLPSNAFSHEFYFVNVILFIALSYIIWHPIVMEVLVWSIAAHIKKRPLMRPAAKQKVAFVTTYVPGSESIELLEKTLPAIIGVDYPHDTWLLDEGNDAAVRELCYKLGVHHFSRYGSKKYNEADGKFARKTKGGNHNSWYDKFGKTYDFVAQIDTDFVPKKNFLTATLGYFNDPKVAFVGTPQVYGNESHSIIAKGAAQQTFNFYGTLLRGMDGMDTTLLIGANHVIRVAALRNVDYYSPHITEDLITGMKLHAKGWTSVYVPEVLAIGEGPIAWRAYFNQQKRWAYGCMHILLNHSLKLFKTMGLRRSIYYYLLQQHYFSGVAMGVSAVLLACYFIGGVSTAHIDLMGFIGVYGTVLVYIMFMQLWLQRFNVRPSHEKGIMLAGMYINLAAWPVYMMAFFSLFKRKKLVYKVTPKGAKALKQNDRVVALFMPHLIIAAISFLSLAAGEYLHRLSPLMVFWAAVTMTLALLVPVFIPLSAAFIKTKVILERRSRTLRRYVISRMRRAFPSKKLYVADGAVGE